jgi:hypothetical protein
MAMLEIFWKMIAIGIPAPPQEEHRVGNPPTTARPDVAEPAPITMTSYRMTLPPEREQLDDARRLYTSFGSQGLCGHLSRLPATGDGTALASSTSALRRSSSNHPAIVQRLRHLRKTAECRTEVSMARDSALGLS